MYNNDVVYRLRLFYELSKHDAWWDGLSHEEQKKHLESNPDSSYRINKLSPEHINKIKGYVEAAPKNRTSFSDHVFHNSDKLTLPVEENPNTDIIPHDLVKNYLDSKGYKIHNYKAGLAVKPGEEKRKLKIGGILDNPKDPAPKDVKKAFVNGRGGASNKDLRVTISRNPEDVASMSTNRGWTSCMNMVRTPNKVNHHEHYLPEEIKHGTHVAYLHHKDDHNILNPIARIALKSFHGNETGHTILKPEEKKYGTSNSDFDHTVKTWTKQHFPMKDSFYIKNPNVYDDDKINIKTKPGLTTNDLDTALRSKDWKVRKAAASNIHVTDSHLNKALDDENKYVRKAAISHKNITKDHLEKGLQDPYYFVRRLSKTRLESGNYKK